MKTIKIYKNYGCLSAEKICIFTFGREASTSVTHDVIEVEIPQDFTICENNFGEKLLEYKDGSIFLINELLSGEHTPCLRGYDKNGVNFYYKLKVIN